jgi:hypothetical protein
MLIPEKSCKIFSSINLIQRCVEIKKKKGDSFYEADPDPKVYPDPRVVVDPHSNLIDFSFLNNFATHFSYIPVTK